METTNIVALLLFVLPGILAEKISHRMDFPEIDNSSEFKDLLNGILLSLPIVSLVGIIAALINNIKTLDSFINTFNDLLFLVTFSVSVFVVAVFVGVGKGLTTDYLYKYINKIRIKFNKMEIDDKSCWRQVFLEKNASRYIKIIKEDKIIAEGFAKHYSLPNEEMSIALEMPQDMDYYIENYPECMEKLKLYNTYINIEKGVIVEVYDTGDLTEYLNLISNS